MTATERRRFACPTLSAPLATGDGLLVRLAPLREALDGAALEMLAAAARRHGSGELELTRRGNLQARGFDAPGAAAFAVAARRLGGQRALPLALALEPRLGAVCDDRLLALRDTLAAALSAFEAPFAAKCAVLLEAQGEWGFAGLGADLRLRLDPDPRGGERLWLGVDGDAAAAQWFAARGGSGLLLQAAMAALERLAAAGPRARGAALRADAGLCARLEALGFERSPAPPSAAALALGRRRTLVVGAAFGALPPGRLAALAALCRRWRLRCWPLPARRLLLAGAALDGSDAEVVNDALAALGMVVDAHDPRLRIDACRGRPGCATAGFDTRALAERLAPRLAALDPTGRAELHLSGCPKGCARSRAATLCLVGGERAGALGVVHEGRADGACQAWLADDADSVAAALPVLLAGG